jgi:putative phage-type endonuclease
MSKKFIHPVFKPVEAEEEYEPGTPEWLRTVSASKIPAILGISPYDSAYSLWAKATGRIEDEVKYKDAAERGNELEPVLLNWLEKKLENSRVRKAPSYVHPDNPNWSAAPDGNVYEGRRRTPYAIAEAKTAMYGYEWGEELTAEIPPGYLSQIAWQMYITGARICYVPALVNMTLRLYKVTWDDVKDDIESIIWAVTAWWQCVITDTPPAWDGSDQTYEAVRKVHPDIDDDGIAVIEAELAQELWEAQEALKAAEAADKLAKTKVLDAAGTAKKIVLPDDTTVATRTARGQGKPFLKIAAKKLYEKVAA